MRWTGGRRSTNVEDYRGRRMGGAGMKLGAGAIVVALLGWFFGIDPRLILGLMEGVQTTQVEPPPPGGVQQTGSATDETAEFMSVVLADTEDTWNALLPKYGKQYVEPKLVLFDGLVQSGCGTAESAMGPFYCPLDQKVYVDMSFYVDLTQRFGAPGDFAQAYVIAHEVGHHVQNLVGTAEKVHAARERASEAESNALSVRMELQADCYAGVWAHHANRSRQLLESGDAEEALIAASAIGDDRLQKQAQGRVVPDAFTHGSSEQRVRWFREGVKSGTPEACDTFNTPQV
jgi:predicted metalloprotease